MHRHIKPNLIYIVTLFSIHASADVIVTTLAGSGVAGYVEDSGTSALFRNPAGLAFDSSGVLYVADRYNNLIRRVTLSGVVTTYAGGRTTTVTDSTGNPASFYQPIGLVFDASGNLFIADLHNYRISIITPSNVISVFAGNGTAGSIDGVGTNASMYYPQAITIDASGNLYVSEWSGNKIRNITSSGIVTTLAGSSFGYADNVGTSAKFHNPFGVVVDSSGNVFVCDSYNQRIRKITSSGNVTTFAGSSAGYSDGIGSAARFYQPSGLAIDSANNLYVADCGNNMVRMVTPAGVVSTVAGNRSAGYADGDPSTAMFYNPYGITLDSSGNIYVSEYNGQRIRVINMGNNPSITTTTSTSTITATNNPPIYSSTTANPDNTNLTIIIALSIVIPIAFIIICASAIGIYMRYKQIGFTWVRMRGYPKLVLIDKKQENA